MKKIVILSLMTLLVSSCGEIYEEASGNVFEGTWVLSKSIDHSNGIPENTPPPNEKNGSKFIFSRKHGDENLLLFYSRGTYDSSFFYRLQDSVIFVRKIKDSVDIKVSGKDQIDSIKISQKPLNPKTECDPEKSYGVFSFSEGAKLNMTIRRYALDAKGAINKKHLLHEDIYERPDENK